MGARTHVLVGCSTVFQLPSFLQPSGRSAGTLLGAIFHAQSPSGRSSGHDVLSAGEGGNLAAPVRLPAGLTPPTGLTEYTWGPLALAMDRCCSTCEASQCSSPTITIAYIRLMRLAMFNTQRRITKRLCHFCAKRIVRRL